MKQLANALSALLTVVCATLAGANWSAEPSASTSSQTGADPRVLVDASGHSTQVKDFRRIASASTVADGLLLQLAEPDRLIAFSAYSAQQGFRAYRYSGKATIQRLDDVEGLLQLKPDLLLASLHGPLQPLERLREAGIEVFDLGEMRGVQAFLDSARKVAALCGRASEGERYAEQFQSRLQRIASDLPAEARKSALYMALLGGHLYGAGKNSNYADVLHYAGLVDLGSLHYEGFPEYTAEDLLPLDPDIVVTREGGRAALCRFPGLSRLRACAEPQRRIVELPEAVISSAGAEMLLAAEWIHRFAYDTAQAGAQKDPR